MNNKRILFACTPADGHFNPLTGLAKYLQTQGYDVRWYASSYYSKKLHQLKITHYPFTKAVDVTATELDERFPERREIKSQVKKINWDLINFFILRGPEYLQDIKNIHEAFPFDIMISDNTFTGVPLVRDVMKIPVIAVGVMPLAEMSKDLAPGGLGITPSTSFAGKIKQSLLRYLAKSVLFAKPNKVMHDVLTKHGVDHQNLFVFDIMSKRADLLLQSGSPGFEYYRSDLSKNVKFIGALLPYTDNDKGIVWYDQRISQYDKVVLVTQGTVEKDNTKIIIPTLEAFKNTNTLVVCTTGGSRTEDLKKAYPHNNIIIEDFIPFNDIMPYADVYVTNGGYGGVMMGVEHGLPLVAAGVHEGKNEICARIGFFKYGINLKTEKPSAKQIKAAVDQVISDPTYRTNITKLGHEFKKYNPNILCMKYVEELVGRPQPAEKQVEESVLS